MTMRIWAIVGMLGASGVIGVCACSGSAIDVGPRTGASGGDGFGGAPGAGGTPASENTCWDTTPLPVWPSATACAGDHDSVLVGRWHGYIENEAAPWDELFLDIKGANSDGLCGTLTVGNATPPAPATDPTRAYPPGNTNGWPLLAGYTLTLLDGRIDGTRIRFGISQLEGYRGWCQLQTSYQRLEGAGGGGALPCSCMPPGEGTAVANSNDECLVAYTIHGAKRTIDCQTQLGCNVGVCACNASGCDSAITSLNGFDLAANGDNIEGSDTAHPGKRMHFARVP